VAGEDERERVAEELSRIRASVRERALLEEPSRLPDARATASPGVVTPLEAPELGEPPLPPDGSAVNAAWDLGAVKPGGGIRGLAGRLLAWALRPWLEAQTAFNSHQVQLDNRTLDYLGRRLDHTHGHYDRVLGIHGRHLADVDERHLILQEELVAHVHDLVRRIDLVLEEAERGRLSLRFQLQELRSRLERIEERLRGE
jgi:hypothetical protein